MFQLKLSSTPQRFPKIALAGATSILAVLGLALLAPQALAHHPFGGQMPTNFLQGFLSGLGHPVIGPDHFAFVVAVGLLASIKQKGWTIPTAFVLAAMVGTGIHLASVDLPVPETAISASVLGFGILLAMKESGGAIALAVLAAIAGIFHGYAYGEAVVGAEITPVIAYLVGFTAIQLGIAGVAYQLGKVALKKGSESPLSVLRAAGFVICGAGAAFLSSALLG